MKNKNEFMLGGIAPDIHGLMGVPKGLTHFKDKNENGKSRINYRRFYETYKNNMNTPFYLGYLCHLISDVVWLDMYFQKVEFVSTEQLKEKLQICYRDFERLNGRIINQYSLQFRQHSIPTNIKIEGYNVDFLPELINLLHKDFRIDADLMNEPLELFKNDNSEIVDYMNNSVRRSIDFLSQSL